MVILRLCYLARGQRRALFSNPQRRRDCYAHRVVRCVAVIMAVVAGRLLAPLPAVAAPAPGELRLGTVLGVHNAYLVGGADFNIETIFRDSVRAHTVRGSISGENFFGVSAGLHLEYGVTDWFAVGTRVVYTHGFAGYRSQPAVRIPMMITFGFSPWSWLELQPVVGAHLAYYAHAAPVAVNFDTGLRVRLFDFAELHGGFLYGAVSGLHFSFSLRLFDIFSALVADQ